MDILFLAGAAVIGTSVRYWSAVLIATLQLVAIVMSAANAIFHAGIPPLVPGALYLVCIGLGIATYVKGLSLAKDHERRETCELLGASSVFGALGVVIVIAVTIAMR